jgi:3-oxoacyl-[acyl-carrier protein] reductase
MDASPVDNEVGRTRPGRCAVSESGSRIAVVTGASRGIGAAVVQALLGRGWQVVFGARNEDGVRRAENVWREEFGDRAAGVAADVRHRADCERLVATAVDRFGGLDLLVNNAGVGRFAPLAEMGDEAWAVQIDTNLTGVFFCCRAAIPHLQARGGGWIINVGSLAGRNPFAGGTAYNASKFGLLGLSEALMLEVRHHNIRVSCVMPGSVATEFGGDSQSGLEWKLHSEDVAQVITDLLAFPGRALPSRVELRPTRPPART